MKTSKKLAIMLICLLPVLFSGCENADELKMPYKLYSSTLNQTGTASPVESIKLNEMKISLTWIRVSQGVFRATLSKAIDIDSTTVLLRNQEIDKICTGGIKDSVTIEFMISQKNNLYQYTDNFSNLVLEIKDFKK